MKLSILIPLYNKEKYIERCLESLLAQDLSLNDYEIIIVDDGSKDSGPLIVKNYTEKYENIRLIEQENQGPSAARNRCLEAAKGDYVYFLDADDYLVTYVLHTILELALQNELDILEFNTKQVVEGSIPEKSTQNHQDVSIKILDGMSYVSEHGFKNEAWRYIIKKKKLVATGIRFMEGTLFEDAIFTASIFLKANKLAKVNLDVHRYVVVENSIVTSKDRAHNLKFIHGMVTAVEHFHNLIKGLDDSHVNYHKVVKQLKSRQQAFGIALIIRTIKYRLLSSEDFKKILMKLTMFEAYPIDYRTGWVGSGKKRIFSKTIFIPFFNNKTFLLLVQKLLRLLPA
ncbi:glycosyltransferase [Sediminicola sp. 1XM1-17]|uniref:glycosyltransferase n=1 Tax=Sediminicola sp. 1XM1-17 TaxID=3127702 RepID=UPI0030778C36